jgi:hypothetical protein
MQGRASKFQRRLEFFGKKRSGGGARTGQAGRLSYPGSGECRVSALKIKKPAVLPPAGNITLKVAVLWAMALSALMLAGAARRILRILRIRAGGALAFEPQLTLRLQPMIHVPAIHSPFAFENLVGALRDLVAVELAGHAAVGGPFRRAAVPGGTIPAAGSDRLDLARAGLVFQFFDGGLFITFS